MRVQDIINESKKTVQEGPVGTAVGAGIGAAVGGPLGAAVGGVAGNWVGDKLSGTASKVKSGWQAFKKGWQSGKSGVPADDLELGDMGRAADGKAYKYKGQLASVKQLPKPGKKGDVYQVGQEFYTYWNGPDWEKNSNIQWSKASSAANGSSRSTTPSQTTTPNQTTTPTVTTRQSISIKDLRNSIKSLSPAQRSKLRNILAAKVGT